MLSSLTSTFDNLLFLFFLPFFFPKYPDTSRDGSNINTVADVESSAQCAVMCNEDKRCMAWSYERNTCYLKDNMPLHAYRAGVTSGETVSLSSSALKRRVIDHFQLFPTISYSFPSQRSHKTLSRLTSVILARCNAIMEWLVKIHLSSKIISKVWKGDGILTAATRWLAKDLETSQTAEAPPWCQSIRTSHHLLYRMTSGLYGTRSKQPEDWEKESRMLAFMERLLSVQSCLLAWAKL